MHLRVRGIQRHSAQLAVMNAELEAQIAERKQAETALALAIPQPTRFGGGAPGGVQNRTRWKACGRDRGPSSFDVRERYAAMPCQRNGGAEAEDSRSKFEVH
jgi:hypothetical protein